MANAGLIHEDVGQLLQEAGCTDEFTHILSSRIPRRRQVIDTCTSLRRWRIFSKSITSAKKARKKETGMLK